MFLPLMGLITACLGLLPLALLYRFLEPEASLGRFYLGSLLWPFLMAALSELSKPLSLWPDSWTIGLVFLAPGTGVLLDQLWRRNSKQIAWFVGLDPKVALAASRRVQGAALARF